MEAGQWGRMENTREGYPTGGLTSKVLEELDKEFPI